MRHGQPGHALTDEFVELRAAGEQVEGDHRCAECGYGVVVQAVLPRCPMCGGETWEPAGRRPVRRRAAGSSAATLR